MSGAPTLGDIRAAGERIRPFAHRTPVITCAALDDLAGARLFFKAENLQRSGSFKLRGAANAVLSLGDAEAARGVATHSSGNHGQALALAARARGVPAHIVMPADAPGVKRSAVEGCGARVVPCEATVASRKAALARVLEETGAVYIPSYDDPRIIAGQGTAAVELLGEVPELDAVVAPVGGGGLASGTAIAVRSISERTRVFGAEPELADDAFRGLREGRVLPAKPPDTIADGLRMPLSELTFSILRISLAGILLVSEEELLAAMRLLFERAKTVVEPSGAVPLAAVLGNRETFAGKRVGVVLSGGNVDLRRPGLFS